MAKVNKEEALTKINEGNGDFHLYSTEEHETFLNNLKDTEVFKQQLDGRISEVHKRYDDDLYEVLGKKRGQDQKTYDFLKTEITALSTSASELKTKNIELQKAVDDKEGDETINLLRSENKSLIEKHQQAKDGWDSQLAEKDGQFKTMKVTNEINTSMTGIKFKDSSVVPEDVRNMAIQTVKEGLVKSADYDDGKLVFKDAEGKILRNESTLIPLTAADLVKDRLKSIIDEGRKQEGVDVKDPKIIEDEDGKIDVTLMIPDSVKTNADLTEFLGKSGLVFQSPEYNAAYKKYSKGLTKV